MSNLMASWSVMGVWPVGFNLHVSEAARHFEHLPRDVVAQVRGEEEDRAGRLLGRAAAPGGDEPEGDFAAGLRDAERDVGRLASDPAARLLRLREPRLDEAEGDGVDLYVELPPLLRQRLSQPDDAGLARGVVGLPGVAARPRRRGDVDDLARGGAPRLLPLALRRLAQVLRRGADDA